MHQTLDCMTQESKVIPLTRDEHDERNTSAARTQAHNKSFEAQREIDLQLLEEQLGAEALAAVLRLVGVRV